MTVSAKKSKGFLKETVKVGNTVIFHFKI
jgi:hypothetical protein